MNKYYLTCYRKPQFEETPTVSKKLLENLITSQYAVILADMT